MQEVIVEIYSGANSRYTDLAVRNSNSIKVYAFEHNDQLYSELSRNTRTIANIQPVNLSVGTDFTRMDKFIEDEKIKKIYYLFIDDEFVSLDILLSFGKQGKVLTEGKIHTTPELLDDVIGWLDANGLRLKEQPDGPIVLFEKKPPKKIKKGCNG